MLLNEFLFTLQKTFLFTCPVLSILFDIITVSPNMQ